nr:MAG TPA: hypothetical protein [Caudoviricetes sp.]
MPFYYLLLKIISTPNSLKLHPFMNYGFYLFT